jgi:hypothetical protein
VPVALPSAGLFATSAPSRFTETSKSPGAAAPPSSLTTWVTTVSCGAPSLSVIVHV